MTQQSIPPVSGVPKPQVDTAYANEIVRAMAIIFSNYFVYGQNHQVTKNSLTQCFEQIQVRLKTAEEINFNVIEDKFLIDGNEVEMKGAVLQKFQDQFGRLGVSGFAIQRGMDLAEFTLLLEIISSKVEQVKAGGGFAQLINNRGLGHARARVVTYQAIEEGQEVISKGEGAGPGAGPGDGSGSGKGGGAGAGDAELTEKAVNDYLSQTGADPASIARQVTEMAGDVKKLAHVVFRSAQQMAGPAGMQPGPEFNSQMVVCIQRTFDALTADPSAKTPTGKKSLVKTLTYLRDALQEDLKKSAGDDAVLDDKIVEMIEDMADELQIDGLALEYLKKRSAIEKSEKRLLRFMRKIEPGTPEAQALQQKLLEAGIPPEKWDELISRGRKAMEQPEDMPNLDKVDAGVFESLLGRLKERLTTLDRIGKEVPIVELQEIMSGLDRELAGLVSRVDRKIRALAMTEEERAEEARAAYDESARRSSLARRRRMELIAQIAQEFCQPLSVIDCSVDMIRKCRAGLITEQQGVLLSMASQSSDRLNGLITELMEICGVPESMAPRENPPSGNTVVSPPEPPKA